ncbi:MAG: phosphoribosylglycinamide formyltransferase [Maricaulaceae bacterium]|nr:phosphoribosylglycinamide formyltransferase [Maricaulaceae bacterium]
MARRRVAILISGRGSNMAALLEAAKAPDYPAEIVLVAADKPDAAGLKTAEQAGVPAAALDRKGYDSREAFEEALDSLVRASGAEIICLAGFMRLLSADFTERWRDRLLNIHPSLLPSFKGLDTHARALAAGVKLHGCTVHIVRPAMDDGPIIGQAAVPVLADDTPDALAARVLTAEHRLYPLCLKLYCQDRARVVEERVRVDGLSAETPLLMWPE